MRMRNRIIVILCALLVSACSIPLPPPLSAAPVLGVW